MPAVCAIHWGANRDVAGLGEGVSPTGAARRRWNQRRRACSCREGGLRAKPFNAVERGGGDVAHRGSDRAGRDAGGAGGKIDPRVAAALEGGAAAVELRRLDPAN